MNTYDLIVVGGGIAGVAAAVSAGRQGLSVLLIEQTGCLGGALTNGLVYPFCQHQTIGEAKKLLSGGLFTEIKERQAAYGDSSWETFKFVFDDMVSEAGVDVLFHATVFRAECRYRSVNMVYVATKSGIVQCQARYFIDASGDGNLMEMVGCDHQLGRESDNLCQPMTTCFRVGGIDVPLFKQELGELWDPGELQKLYQQHRKDGKIQNPRENILVFYGLGEDIVHFNTTRVVKLNPVDALDVSRAEMIARRQAYETFAFLKKHSKACANATLLTIANSIGIRESRKLKGVHILTTDELLSLQSFDDTIALGNYSIDIHNPEGTGTVLHCFKDDEFYQIPYRSLLPKEYDNLLVAGRCLSAEHEAHAAVRIMPICSCLGEAAGTAIALAKESNTNTHTLDVSTLQTRLLENGAILS